MIRGLGSYMLLTYSQTLNWYEPSVSLSELMGRMCVLSGPFLVKEKVITKSGISKALLGWRYKVENSA